MGNSSGGEASRAGLMSQGRESWEGNDQLSPGYHSGLPEDLRSPLFCINCYPGLKALEKGDEAGIQSDDNRGKPCSVKAPYWEAGPEGASP